MPLSAVGRKEARLLGKRLKKEGFSGKELREKKFNTVEVAEFWGERHQFGYIRKSVNTLAGLGRLMNDLYIAAGYEDALVRSICIRNGWHFLLDVHYHKCDGRYFSKCAVAYDPVNMETLRYSGEYGFIVELGAPEWKKGRETWPVASSKAGRKKGGMARVADILNDLYYEQEDF